MKIIQYSLFLTLIAAFFACRGDRSAKELQDSLLVKEKQIVVLQQQLRVKQDSLQLFKNAVDSGITTQDSGLYKPQLVGNWAVKMECIETTCQGFAVGDTKNEHWEISYEGNELVAKAVAEKKVSRVYKGIFKNGQVRLTNTDSAPDNLMTITLQYEENNEQLKGIREIVRGDECHIRYSLQVSKQDQ